MPRPARKRDEILAGAARAFRRLGYERSSMDAVAREAGVSKATLYRYFSAKDDLFRAVVEASPPARLELPFTAGGPAETLRRLGHAILAAATDEGYLGLLRVTLGEGARFPELGQALRARVIDRMLPAFEQVITGWMTTGKLRPLHPRLAAQEFVHMLLGYVIIMRLVPGEDDWGLTDAEVVEQAVTIFLHGATARDAGGPREASFAAGERVSPREA